MDFSANNESCAPHADEVSCDAQIQLAKEEIARLSRMNALLMSNPTCRRQMEMPDRREEHDLIKSQPTGLKYCYAKREVDPNGQWQDQFTLLTPDYTKTVFDQWSRNKTPCTFKGA